MEYNTKYIQFDNLALKRIFFQIFPVVFPGFSRVSPISFLPSESTSPPPAVPEVEILHFLEDHLLCST